jgi:GNAT superfamily N-acetyltransferase
MLARAFRDNPLNRAAIRSNDPRRRLHSNRHGMRSLLPAATARGQLLVARCSERVVGALIAAPPGAYPLPPPPPLQRIRCLLGQGFRVAARWGQAFAELDAQHPLEPSWYLGTLGVEPASQGRGVGTELLETWILQVDRDRSPAYLETDLQANVGFYARFGFALAGEIEVLGTPIWRMWREPAGPRISTSARPQ